jgi:hypothetical protein
MDPALAFDPTLLRQVQSDSLEPHQQPTAPNFKTACDFRQQVMRKHPYLSDFHSYAEYLHAGLLEGDPAITRYVPQPFRLRVRGKRYTPDCYVEGDGQPRRVVELKPRGEMPDDQRIPLLQYFAHHGLRFEVLSNEAVIERQTEAENWLEIVRILHLARDLTTSDAEQAVLEQLYRHGPCSLGDLIDPGDRERTYPQEIALFRLLHRGVVQGELTEQPLDYDTRLWLCASPGANV